MSDTKPIFDFEHRGYRLLAEDNPDKQGEARIRIFKGLDVVREFGWPVYKVWNIQAHAGDIVDGLEKDKDDGIRLAGGTGFGGTVYTGRTLTERLFDAANTIEHATAHNEVTGNLAMPEDEDDPEGTLIVKMSETIRKALATLLRDAATHVQALNVSIDVHGLMCASCDMALVRPESAEPPDPTVCHAFCRKCAESSRAATAEAERNLENARRSLKAQHTVIAGLCRAVDQKMETAFDFLDPEALIARIVALAKEK
jgi:hypothetical protein